MADLHASRGSSHADEEGFVLIAVIFLVALLTISLAIAMPKVIKQIQRDRELETMNRGKQYARAVRMYYKKFGSYPPNMDALVKPTNNIRFLRKKYSDPTTGKPDWKPIGVGMNKAPTVMGFFGKPLGGVGGGCGTNPAGTGSPQSTSSFGSSSSSSSSSFGTTGSQTDASASSNCAGIGSNTNTSTPTGTGTTNPTDPSAAGATTDTSSNSSASGSAFGQNGQTFGGLGIMGFSPNSPKPSIMVYKTKHKYNEWEFVYDPQAEQLMMQSGLTGAGGNGLSGQSGGMGGPGGNPGFGGNPGLGGGNTGFGGNQGMGGNSGLGGNNATGGSSGSPTQTPQTTTQ